MAHRGRETTVGEVIPNQATKRPLGHGRRAAIESQTWEESLRGRSRKPVIFWRGGVSLDVVLKEGKEGPSSR